MGGEKPPTSVSISSVCHGIHGLESSGEEEEIAQRKASRQPGGPVGRMLGGLCEFMGILAGPPHPPQSYVSPRNSRGPL